MLRATAGPSTLTALKISCSIDALPGASTPSKHAACRPAWAILYARAAADPAPLDGGDGGGARTGSDALAIASHIGRRADTCGWVRCGKGRVAFRASESAGISVDTCWHAVNGVVAGRRRIAYDLKIKHNQAHLCEGAAAFLRTRFVKAVMTACVPAIATPCMATGLVCRNWGSPDRQRQESVKIIIPVRTLAIG